MAWAFVRPRDPDVVSGRPLLDLGTGDGQTLRALAPEGFVVGVDRRLELLTPGSVGAAADALPFAGAVFATVLAADLLHHLTDEGLGAAMVEIARVLAPAGRLVAWWYERTADPSPDAPRHPRPFAVVAAAARRAGLDPAPLELEVGVPGSATVGLVATR